MLWISATALSVMRRLVVRRLMSVTRRRGRPRCRIQTRQIRNNGSISWGKSKGSPYRQDDNCHLETKVYSRPFLPVDIWRHIHSLMPLRDAARAACVCRAFLYSWRTRPNLTFSNETLGVNESSGDKVEIARDFSSKVDQIMKNHLGGSLRTFKLLNAANYNARYRRYLDSWLHTAITPKIEELNLIVDEHFTMKKYKFPCSVLSHGNGDALRYLSLEECAFHPSIEIGCLRSLARLDLFCVCIKGDELGCLLSNSLALESLKLSNCYDINCVKIPCLRRLTHLSVIGCVNLQVITSKAPNLCSFHFGSSHRVQLSVGKVLQLKKLYINCSGDFCYSRAELASSMGNLETTCSSNEVCSLVHNSSNQMVNTSVASSKFVCFKFLGVTLHGVAFPQSFDYFSLASPSVETFVLDVSRRLMDHPNYDQIRFYSHAGTWVNLACDMLRAWLS